MKYGKGGWKMDGRMVAKTFGRLVLYRKFGFAMFCVNLGVQEKTFAEIGLSGLVPNKPSTAKC